MIKLQHYMILAAFGSLGFTSCGDSEFKLTKSETDCGMECDVKKLLELMCEANALEERWKAGEDVEEQGRALAHDVDFMWDALVKKYEDQKEEWFETYKSAQAKSYAENGCPPNQWDLP